MPRLVKKLSANDIIKILEEDIPVDNDMITDESDLSNDEETNFDDIFDKELKKLFDSNNADLHTENENVQLEELNIGENENNQNLNNVEANISRLWKKEFVETKVPDYNFHEGAVSELVADCNTPTDFFVKLLGPVVEHLVFHSNLYAIQNNRRLNIDKNELLSFLGINFFMGYHKLPSYKHYWFCDEDMEIAVVKKTMTRHRFQQIISSLHANDNTLLSASNKDKLYKLRPVINFLNNQFALFHTGTRQLAVDESMILFKGRSSLKQFLPMKPIKRGYKMWVLADQNGYIKKFKIYEGKDGEIENKFKNYGLGERVVLNMTEEEWGKERMVFFDNFFTTIRLLERLKSEHVLACGTIRENRLNVPKDMVSDKLLKKGDYDYRISHQGISYFKWCDTKVVRLCSNFHGTEETLVKRKQKDGSILEVPCPGIIKDYCQNMGAVDKADYLRLLYGIDRKSKKWWHRIFFALMDITFVNSFIIYCEIQEKISLLDFRRCVARGLMKLHTQSSNKRKSIETGACLAKKRKYNFSVPDDIRFANKGNHWVKYVKNRGRCEMCSSKGIQSRPHSVCSSCNIFLCCNEKKNCFLEFHKVNL